MGKVSWRQNIIQFMSYFHPYFPPVKQQKRVLETKAYKGSLEQMYKMPRERLVAQTGRTAMNFYNQNSDEMPSFIQIFLKLFASTSPFHLRFKKNPSPWVQFQICFVPLIIYHQLLIFQFNPVHLVQLFIQIKPIFIQINDLVLYILGTKKIAKSVSDGFMQTFYTTHTKFSEKLRQ